MPASSSIQPHTVHVTQPEFSPWVRVLRWLIVLVLSAAAIYYVCMTIHWQIMEDAPVMHYVNFLIDHGRMPYTDITDNNMPGAYFTESIAMHIFGYGDVGWRVYDFVLMAIMTGALVLIAMPYDWMAGLFAGGLFFSMHEAEGPKYSLEREQVITVLLVIGYAALFRSVRRRQPAWMLLVGLTGGLATSIKPTFLPLTLALLLMAAWVLWRRGVAWLPYMAWAFAGLAAMAAADLLYLLHFHALGGFLYILRVVTPTYGGLARSSLWTLLRLSLDWPTALLLALTLLAALVSGRRHMRWEWEKWAIALGVLFGWLSYFVQGKPFLHHRYTYLVLLLLLIGLESMEALRRRGPQQRLAAAALLFALFVAMPIECREVLHIHRQMPTGQTPFTLALEDDLNRLGGAPVLQDKVQCMDLVYGCLDALYHLDIVENTSYTGDLLLFTKRDSVAAEYYKNKYWALDHVDPASVIVMSNEWFQEPNSFDKLRYWPAFAAFLQTNYTQVVQRRFVGEGMDAKNPDGYRIYIRNNSPLMSRAQLLTSVYQTDEVRPR
jgi:hypothetical protein